MVNIKVKEGILEQIIPELGKLKGDFKEYQNYIEPKLRQKKLKSHKLTISDFEDKEIISTKQFDKDEKDEKSTTSLTDLSTTGNINKDKKESKDND